MFSLSTYFTREVFTVVFNSIYAHFSALDWLKTMLILFMVGTTFDFSVLYTQMLSAATALRLRNALSGVTGIHLANNIDSNDTDQYKDVGT